MLAGPLWEASDGPKISNWQGRLWLSGWGYRGCDLSPGHGVDPAPSRPGSELPLVVATKSVGRPATVEPDVLGRHLGHLVRVSGRLPAASLANMGQGCGAWPRSARHHWQLDRSRIVARPAGLCRLRSTAHVGRRADRHRFRARLGARPRRVADPSGALMSRSSQ